MSKLGLLVLLLSFQAVFAQDKAVTPRYFAPKDIKSQNRIKASSYFNAGVYEFDKGNFDLAYSNFIKASEQDQTPLKEKSVALYNAALSLERSKKYKKAIEQYTIISSNEKLRDSFKDAYYRISACCHELKDWACIIGSIENWKNYGQPLSISEKFEYMIRKGTALYELKLYNEAIEYLSSATKTLNTKKTFLYADSIKRGFGEGKINQLALWGLEALAGSYEITGDNIRISYLEEDQGKINIESLSKLLELKAYYYLKAQEAYLDMLNYGDKDSATKGIYLLGELYTNIYNNLLNTEIPPDIKELKLEKNYMKKLKESLSPIIKKAKNTHNKNIELSNDLKFTNEWIEKSKKALTLI